MFKIASILLGTAISSRGSQGALEVIFHTPSCFCVIHGISPSFLVYKYFFADYAIELNAV